MKNAIIFCMLLITISVAFAQDGYDTIFIKLVNDYRVSKGLSVLTYDPLLDSACVVQSSWMILNEKIDHGIGVHTRLEQIDPYYKDKIRQSPILENCFGHTYSNARPFGDTLVTEKHVHEAFDGWLASPGHHMAIVLAESTSIGFDIRGKFMKDGRGYIIGATMVVGTKVGSPVTNISSE